MSSMFYNLDSRTVWYQDEKVGYYSSATKTNPSSFCDQIIPGSLCQANVHVPIAATAPSEARNGFTRRKHWQMCMCLSQRPHCLRQGMASLGANTDKCACACHSDRTVWGKEWLHSAQTLGLESSRTWGMDGFVDVYRIDLAMCWSPA
jgi:hypothetical protein